MMPDSPKGYSSLEDVLRGSVRRGEPDRLPAATANPQNGHSVLASPLDIQQMSDMLDAQFRLREAAQLGRAQAIRALEAAAEALCPREWDAEKRAGRNPEGWGPEQIGEFVVRHVRVALQHAVLAQQADLASEYKRLSADLANAREEIGRLRMQLQHSQASVKALMERLAKEPKARSRMTPVAVATDGSPEAVEHAGDSAIALEDTRQLDAVPPERVDAVITLIAATGLSRSDEVRERLAGQWSANRGSSRVGLAVRAALHRGLLTAYPCVVEWPGEKTRQFLVLTPAGRARAVELNVAPVENEYEAGLKLHKTAEHLYLVLKAVDILRAEGYRDVTYLPECFQVAGGEYCPDIAAREDGRPVYIECERSQDKAREAKWSRAAQANGGIIRLVTPNRKIMDAITSEIKATTGSEFKIWAFNISEYAAGVRGPNNSIWLHQR